MRLKELCNELSDFSFYRRPTIEEIYRRHYNPFLHGSKRKTDYKKQLDEAKKAKSDAEKGLANAKNDIHKLCAGRKLTRAQMQEQVNKWRKIVFKENLYAKRLVVAENELKEYAVAAAVEAAKSHAKVNNMVWGVNSQDNIYYRHGEQGNWTHVPGGLKQISNGPVGTFGVNEDDEIFYRVGTHEDNNSAGSGWQKLPGKLSYISAGLNAVWGVNSSDEIFCLTPIKLNDKHHVDFNSTDWQKIPGGLKQISASKDSDVVWGVNRAGYIYYKLDKNPKNPWQGVPGRLMQIEVGNAGVYGVNKWHQIWYRTGTNAKPASKGTGWKRLPGALKHITVGQNSIWGANSDDYIYVGEPNTRPKWKGIPGRVKKISTY